MNSKNGYYYTSIEKSGNTFLVVTTILQSGLRKCLDDGFIPVDPETWEPVNYGDDYDFKYHHIVEAFNNGDIDLIKEV